MNRSSTPRLTLAIGAEGITARVSDDERTYMTELDATAETRRAAMVQAFAALARMIGMERSASPRNMAVDVAIMPSFCEVRLVPLPPLKAAEAEFVIRRDAGKYFTVTSEQRVIAVRVPSRARGSTGASAAAGGANAAAPLMAAAVSQSLLNDISAAAATTEWDVQRVVPAQASWLRAGAVDASRDTTRARAVIAVAGDTAHIMRIENGSPVDLRRMPSGNAAGIAAALGTPGSVVVLGDGSARGALTSALSAAGWSALPSSASAAAAAAQHASDADLVFLTEVHHATRATQQRTLANRLAIAAVVLLLISAALAHWGAKRELSAIRARRAAIHARVSPLLALRDSVDALDVRSRETDALFSTQPRWSKTLYEMTILLPQDAHLTRLNATGDTIVIEGEAVRAGDVLEAIGRAPSLRNVQLQGPVQRDLADGATTAERFSIQATLASAVTPAPKAKRHVSASASKSDSLTLEGKAR